MSLTWPRVFALAVGLGLGCAQPALAASPTVTLVSFFEQANAVVRTVDPNRELEEPRQAIRDLVNEVIDFRDAAAVALGPPWQSMAPEDQDEFVRLFSNVLERGFVAAIVTRANMTGGVKVHFLGESIDGNSASVATTLLSRNGSELPVDYWLIRRGGRWKVQDVAFDGVSLISNYRAQFSRVLRDFSYSELVAKMRGEVAAAPQSEAGPGAIWVMGHMRDEQQVPETQPVRQERD
jgi:phospholipid transport system substrate-binding protein